jgi:hypothetical protein
MEPNPAPPPMTPTGPSNPYDFLHDSPKPKKSLLPSGNSKIQRIVIALIGAVLLIIIVVVVMSILSGPGKSVVNDMVLAAQQQQELIRIAEIGEKDATTPDTKNFVVSTRLTLESDKIRLHAIVNKSQKLDDKLLAQGKDSNSDKTLTTAKQTNRFDEVFTELLKKELREYQQTLKRVHDASSNKSNKAVLAEQFQHVGLLISD